MKLLRAFLISILAGYIGFHLGQQYESGQNEMRLDLRAKRCAGIVIALWREGQSCKDQLSKCETKTVIRWMKGNR